MTAPQNTGTPRVDEANDDLVQHLVVASWAEAQSPVRVPSPRRSDPLTVARRELSASLAGAEPQPGDLVRNTPATERDTSTPDTHSSTMDRAATDPAPSQPDQGELSRVMIVDDHDDLRALLHAQLESLPGILVVGEASDGAEAVQLAPELRPDVVFMDLAMPVMDGLTAIPLLLEALPHVRVIVHSGFDQGMAGDAAIRAGASHYLEKGRRTDFAQVIRDVLED